MELINPKEKKIELVELFYHSLNSNSENRDITVEQAESCVNILCNEILQINEIDYKFWLAIKKYIDL
jgi:hypothetical protein